MVQYAPRSPAILAVISQAVGLVVGVLIWRYAPLEPRTALWITAVSAGVCAACCGKFIFNLPSWWLPINALFAPAVIGAMALNLPGWVYLAAFVVTLTVFWNAGSDRVPLYLTNNRTWEALSGLLPKSPNTHFIDLGSGLSGTLRYLALHHPDKRFVGVESAPIPLLIASLRQWFRPLSNLRQDSGDLWQVDLSPYDVVYCFLSPAPMGRLYDKAKREMRPGSMLISNSFDVPNYTPDEEYTVNDRRQTRLMIWRF